MKDLIGEHRQRLQAGRREGHGIETFHNGEKYVGQYLGDRREGLGTAYYSNGQLKYVGEWNSGKWDVSALLFN